MFYRLPSEILDCIFDYLEVNDIINFGFTCKEAYSVVQSSLVWDRLSYEQWNVLDDDFFGFSPPVEDRCSAQSPFSYYSDRRRLDARAERLLASLCEAETPEKIIEIQDELYALGKRIIPYLRRRSFQTGLPRFMSEFVDQKLLEADRNAFQVRVCLVLLRRFRQQAIYSALMELPRVTGPLEFADALLCIFCLCDPLYFRTIDNFNATIASVVKDVIAKTDRCIHGSLKFTPTLLVTHLFNSFVESVPRSSNTDGPIDGAGWQYFPLRSSWQQFGPLPEPFFMLLVLCRLCLQYNSIRKPTEPISATVMRLEGINVFCLRVADATFAQDFSYIETLGRKVFIMPFNALRRRLLRAGFVEPFNFTPLKAEDILYLTLYCVVQRANGLTQESFRSPTNNLGSLLPYLTSSTLAGLFKSLYSFLGEAPRQPEEPFYQLDMDEYIHLLYVCAIRDAVVQDNSVIKSLLRHMNPPHGLAEDPAELLKFVRHYIAADSEPVDFIDKLSAVSPQQRFWAPVQRQFSVAKPDPRWGTEIAYVYEDIRSERPIIMLSAVKLPSYMFDLSREKIMTFLDVYGMSKLGAVESQVNENRTENFAMDLLVRELEWLESGWRSRDWPRGVGQQFGSRAIEGLYFPYHCCATGLLFEGLSKRSEWDLENPMDIYKWQRVFADSNYRKRDGN